MNTISKKNVFLKGNNWFYLFYLVAIVMFMLSRSVFNINLKIGYATIFILFFLSLILNKTNGKELLLLLVFLFVSYTTGNIECLCMLLLIFAMRKFPVATNIKYIIMTIFCFLVLIYLCTVFNIIPNLVYYRENAVRYAMGMQFPLVFSGYVFYGCVYLALYYYKMSPLKVFSILILLVVLLDRTTNSRNDELCIILLAIIVLLNKASISVKKSIFSVASGLTALLIIVSMFVTKLIPYKSNIYTSLDMLFSGRLNLQYALFERYTPRLFGQYIPQRGWQNLLNFNDYFYIDNSYLRILFMDGAIFFFCLLIIICFKLRDLWRKKLFIVGMILLVVLLNAITSDTFSTLTQNVIILPLFFVNYESTQYNKNMRLVE